MRTLCNHTGCDRRKYCKGYCASHYQQLKMRGATWDLGSTLTLEARLGGKYMVDAVTGCWLWTGWLSKSGYGVISVKGHGKAGRQPAHRAMYELRRGPIPDGLALDHQCHNRDLGCPGGKACLHRRCVNPEHLEPATNQENSARGRAGEAARRRMAQRTHCKNGHILSADNVRINVKGHRFCMTCVREKQRAHDGRPQTRARGPLREVLRREGKTVWLSCGHVLDVTSPHRQARAVCTPCEHLAQHKYEEGAA